MFRTTIVLCCIAVLAPLVSAQTESKPDTSLQSIIARLGGRQLKLSEANESALKNSTLVLSAEAAYASAEGAARREAGAFDPLLFFNLNYREDRVPGSSPFAGADVLSTLQTNGAAGLRILSPIGTSIEASVSTVRFATNSTFATLNPQYNAIGSLSFRQPLLKGFHLSARKFASQTDEQETAAKARYDQAVIAVTTTVEQAYWDLYAAERDFAAQTLARDQADQSLKETRLRASTGLVGPSQVAIARTFLAEQEVALLDRQEALDAQSDRLASLIGMRPDSATPRFLAADSPPSEFSPGDESMLVSQATENNLDLRAYKSEIEANRSLSRAALWEALPSVNLVGSLIGNGLGGNPQQVIFGTDTLPLSAQNGSFGDAIDQSVRRLYPSWTIGIEVSIPIGLRPGLGEKERLDAEVSIAEQRYIDASRSLGDQVRASYRALSNGSDRLKAARDGVEAAQEQVRIGLIEFQNGRTTAFELVRLEADLAAAQQRYSQALVRGAKAAADLRQLTSGAYK